MKKICSKIVLFTIILFMLSSVLSCSKSNQTIRIATKTFTEQFILGEMLSVLIEDKTDLKVELTKNVSTNIHEALLSNQFDLYPEYTGTAWNYIMKKTYYPDDDTIWAEILNTYNNEYKMDWVGLYGFNNAYGLAVRTEIAQKYNIKTYSDLVPYAKDLVFGSEGSFYEREDGFNGLCAKYGFTFKDKVDMNVGLKYQAIEDGQIDVVVVFTTDAKLNSPSIVVLEDDKGYFPHYFAGTVIRSDVLKKHPELKDTLLLMDGLISDKEMIQMNYEIEVNKRDEREVVTEFLKSKNIIK